jgi:hypothetical protein
LSVVRLPATQARPMSVTVIMGCRMRWVTR